MNVYYDWIDWLGGYPFEVASVEEIFRFYKNSLKYSFVFILDSTKCYHRYKTKSHSLITFTLSPY